MKNPYIVLMLMMVLLSGCATKTAYLNTQRPSEEIKKDKYDCQKAVDKLSIKDEGQKRKRLNQCMKDKGYNVVSEKKARKLQGFLEVWIKPQSNFKGYEAIFIDKVGLAQLKVDMNLPKFRASQKDIDNLGQEMYNRFSKALGFVLPVIPDEQKIAGKKVLYVRLELEKATQTNLGLNTGLQVVGQFTPPYMPLPDAPLGTFSFKGEVSDYSSREKLIVVFDECDEDDNASLAGIENFEKWKHAYNIMDYWADHLASLLTKERGQKYKSRLGIKLIDF